MAVEPGQPTERRGVRRSRESHGGSTEATGTTCRKARRTLHVTVTETTIVAPFLLELLHTESFETKESLTYV